MKKTINTFFSGIKNISHFYITAVFVFMFGVTLQLTLQKIAQPDVINGHLFQVWSSEAFMHTVPIELLRDSPLTTLTNIHIQPPGLDFLRAVFIQFYASSETSEALKQVDISLYSLWVILYGSIGAIVFVWLGKLLNFWIALLLSIIFFLHPALIFYATFLDTTLISSLLVLLMYYLLWRIYKEKGSVFPLIFTVILLFFFRSVFQIPFILCLTASLFFLKVDHKKIKTFLALTLIICGAYIVKQKIQFDLTTTSSFLGINLVRSVDINENRYPYIINFDAIQTQPLPAVLTQQKKINGEINYNHIQYLEFNKGLIEKYKEYISEFHPKALFYSYIENVNIYFRPSSAYTEHVIVDKLPWRNTYNKIFSSPILPILLSISMLSFLKLFLRKDNFLETLAFLLPAGYIFLTCTLFEKGENNRFKFFLEPVFFIFISTQFYYLYHCVYSLFKKVLYSKS